MVARWGLARLIRGWRLRLCPERAGLDVWHRWGRLLRKARRRIFIKRLWAACGRWLNKCKQLGDEDQDWLPSRPH